MNWRFILRGAVIAGGLVGIVAGWFTWATATPGNTPGEVAKADESIDSLALTMAPVKGWQRSRKFKTIEEMLAEQDRIEHLSDHPDFLNQQLKAQIEIAFSDLRGDNVTIAHAKLIADSGYFPDASGPYSPSSWSWVKEYESKPWVIEEPHQKIKDTAWASFTWGLGGGVATGVFLLLMSAMWRFFLARLRELSQAIRGK